MALLTIDDVPSSRFAEKRQWLRGRGIPALLFVWGEKAHGREDELAEALGEGFVLGNHSWTHPHFSTLDFGAAREEIEKTHRLLEDCYGRAGLPWTNKRFRFPYFDRGADDEARGRLQELLAQFGYEGLPGITTAEECADRDTLCTFNQAEYWLGNPDAPEGLHSAVAILDRIGTGRPGSEDVILIHDHDYSHELFFQCVEKYESMGLSFHRPE